MPDEFPDHKIYLIFWLDLHLNKSTIKTLKLLVLLIWFSFRWSLFVVIFVGIYNIEIFKTPKRILFQPICSFFLLPIYLFLFHFIFVRLLFLYLNNIYGCTCLLRLLQHREIEDKTSIKEEFLLIDYYEVNLFQHQSNNNSLPR